MKGKVWKRIRESENKNWGKKTSFSNVISPLVTGLVSIVVTGRIMVKVAWRRDSWEENKW